MARNNEMPEVEIGEAVEDELDEPRRFKVYMHNDDYTPMDFVVHVLERVFYKDETEAHIIMMNIHENGVGLCGIYTAEIAETRISLVHSLAQAQGYPLKCSMEEA